MSEVHVHIHGNELAQRKPDPPPAAPLPDNPAWVQEWPEQSYTPARRPVERVRNPIQENRQVRNYLALVLTVLGIVTAFNGCVNAIQAEARDQMLEEMLMFKGVIE